MKDLKARARECGFKISEAWNISSTLSRSDGRAINTPNGWEITEAGRQHLRDLGIDKIAPEAKQVAHDLRSELANIRDADTKAFVEEAVKCFEFGLYRSAVVMSWLAAVDVFHKYVHAHRLADFNGEASRVDPKWKNAVTPDDLGRMKESDFLDRLVAISVLNKNVRKELGNCLDRRNGCGHPNSLKLSANTAAHHLEILLLNVFKVFQ